MSTGRTNLCAHPVLQKIQKLLLYVENNVLAIAGPKRVTQVVSAEVHDDNIKVIEIDEITLEETVENNKMQKGFWNMEESCDDVQVNKKDDQEDDSLVMEDDSDHSRKKKDTFVCEVCALVFASASELTEHESIEHSKQNNCFECEPYAQTFEIESELTEHVNTEHLQSKERYECEVCTKRFDNAECLKKHLDEQHNTHQPNEPRVIEVIKYACEKCSETFDTKANLAQHKQDKHAETNNDELDSKERASLIKMKTENERLNKALETLKDDFERLNDIFETSKSNGVKDANETEIELEKVREEFRVAKTQNEFLLEKNETLYKLGKIAMEKNSKQVPEVEIFDDDDQEGLDTLVKSSIETRKSGFRRSTPAAAAEAQKNNVAQPQPNTAKSGKHDNKKQSEADENNKEVFSEDNGKLPKSHRVSYCHYFSNFGKCTFEERSGRKCKFTHEKAPMCTFDRKCNRQKCMFTHSKPDHKQAQYPQYPPHQNSPFLDQGTQYPTNPWEMMTALLQATQNQANPWNMNRRNSAGKLFQRLFQIFQNLKMAVT